MTSFNPKKDIPSLSGKTIVITGGNDGLGKQTALDLAQHGHPAQLWILARNATTAATTIQDIKARCPSTVSIQFLALDLSSLASVKSAAEQLLAKLNRLDILICNAGLMAGKAALSDDGYELRVAVNHLGHALLMTLLAPLMLKTGGQSGSDDKPRIVSLSSAGHRWVPPAGIEFASLTTTAPSPVRTPVDMYCQAKLAQVLWARHFAAKYPGITSVSINPGDIKTNLYTDTHGPWFFPIVKAVVLPFRGGTVEEGALNSLWAATAGGVVSGEYYDPVGKGNTATVLSRDEGLVRRLSEWTEGAIKKFC